MLKHRVEARTSSGTARELVLEQLVDVDTLELPRCVLHKRRDTSVSDSLPHALPALTSIRCAYYLKGVAQEVRPQLSTLSL